MKPSMKNSSFIEATKKKWFYPILYGAAALAIAGMAWGYDVWMTEDTALPVSLEVNEPNSPVTLNPPTAAEVLAYPYSDDLAEEMLVIQPFYDLEASEEERSKSIMVFNQTYSTSSGITLSKSNEPFEVRAALSGEVTNIIEDEFMGNAVVLKHENGLETYYRSVIDIAVAIGDEVQQGDMLATSSTNHWNTTAGNHLLFEVKENGVYINPAKYIAF